MGLSTLDHVVYHNRHRGLAVLLKLGGPKISLSDSSDEFSLLGSAALCADTRTLRILTYYASYLAVDSTKVEDIVEMAFEAAHRRIFWAKKSEELNVIYLADFVLKDPLEWFELFKNLAFEIYTLSGGKRDFKLITGEETDNSHLGHSSGKDVSGGDLHNFTILESNKNKPESEDDEEKSSDEEWHVAHEQ